MTNNTIPNVPRELLERVLYLMDNYIGTTHTEEDELRALLSAPSPAGVDGLEVMSNWVLFDAEADKPYIKKMLPEGFLAFFDCEEDARRAKANNPGTDYKRIDRVKAEDAQAIIDGLRGEVARLDAGWHAANISALAQAQRIGELAELAAQASVNCKNTAYYLRKYRPDLADICSGWCVAIDAALSAGK